MAEEAAQNVYNKKAPNGNFYGNFMRQSMVNAMRFANNPFMGQFLGGAGRPLNGLVRKGQLKFR